MSVHRREISIHEQLREELVSRLPSATFATDPGVITFGVEHEFFLTTPDGNPCNHLQSQRFFRVFVEQNVAWELQVEKLRGTQLVERALFGDEWSGAQLKYEYDPHLLEISTPIMTSLTTLLAFFQEIWSATEVAAKSCGLQVTHSPALEGVDMLQQAERTRRPDTAMLLAYRKKLVANNGEPAKLAGFPAVVAATQVHVGGINWGSNEAVVEALYSQLDKLEEVFYEPFDDKSSVRDLRQRGYCSVFRGFPLVGTPPFRPWNFRGWIDALLNSPLAGTNEAWAGKTVTDIGGPPNNDWQLFVERVRDLQWIRPRLFGTLEFRGAPAQPSPDSIVQLASTILHATRAFAPQSE